MDCQLLPPWSQYLKTLPLNAKEPMETFGWLPKKEAVLYEDFHQALNCVEGSREWLCTQLKNMPMETFGWLPKKEAVLYEDFHQALNCVEGSREWLCTQFKNIYDDTVLEQVSAKMKMSDEHTANTMHALVYLYIYALKDWDNWVYKQKTRVAHDEYKMRQLPYYDLLTLSAAIAKIEGGGLLGSDFEANHANFIKLKHLYGISGTNDEIIALVNAVMAEI